MSLLKYTVLKQKKDLEPEGEILESVLLNTDHIVSLKPINIILNSNVVKGFWVRMANDKKYKATRIPDQILELFEDEISKEEMGAESQVNGNELSLQ